MDDANWQRVREVFDAALQQAPAARQNYINEACGDDEGLLTEVESLFSSLDQSDEFLETPAVAHVADVIESPRKLLARGTRFGHYELIQQIGIGGMGEVYLANDLKLDRQVAIKILSDEFSHDENLKRFEREAKAASALNHPNILVIHEVGESKGTHYIVSEFIEGRTLREVLTAAQMSLEEVVDTSIQIANALSAAHGAHLVHRDIKPENLMVRPDGYVKVLDFGLAKLMQRRRDPDSNGFDEQEPTIKPPSSLPLPPSASIPGVILGTIGYMSPEQAKGELVDERTDIFSFGVVLYEMLAGRTPFAGQSQAETFANLINAEPPPLSASNVPEELKRIVAKTLRKTKDERYSTMKDVLTELRDLDGLAPLNRSPSAHANGRGATTKTGGHTVRTAFTSADTAGDVVTGRPTSSAEYLIGMIKRHKRGALLTAAAALIAIAAAVYFSYPTNRGEAIDSVAVMPFINVSGDPNVEYLSEGISDSIIMSLSRLPNLKVNSLNSVLRYKGKQIDAQSVGRELNVRAVLIGRMTQQADGLAISTELVDVHDHKQLWSEHYNRKLSDILVLQDEIAREITEGLRLRLTGEEKQQLSKQPTENPEAYLLYSLGKYSSRPMSREAFEKSIEYFSQAIKIDPNYAAAYAALATTYQFMGSRGFSPPRESQQKVEWAALKALHLDDTLAEAHIALGASKFITFDWVGAEKELKRALELDPNSFQANEAYSIYLRTVRGGAEGLPYAIRARELDASPDRGEGAFAYYMARQYDKAIELYRKSIEKKPDNAHAHILLGEAHVAKGLPAEGVTEMQKGIALDADKRRWDRYPLLSYAYAAAGRRKEALQILGEQKKLAKQGYVSPYNFAIIYTGLGDKDRAFEWLSKCVEERVLIIFHLKSRPLFDSLRLDPRYVELLRRMNLEP